MTNVLWPLFALVLFAVQTHWFMLFQTTQAPDLLLLFLLLFALDAGGKRGARCGFFLGALQDITTFSFLGYHILTRFLLGLFIGGNREKIFKDKLPTFFVLVAIVSVVMKSITTIFLVIYHGHLFSLWPMVYNTVKFVGWNLLCSVPMWVIYRMLRDYIDRRENPYYHF